MAGKRFRYLVFLLLFGAYYLSSGEWLSWFLLVSVLALPWFSLAISLPAIFQFRAGSTGTDTATVGDSLQLWLLGSCDLPLPPFQGVLCLEELFTGTQTRFRGEQSCIPAHCGGLRIRVEKPKVYDYMGLFSFPVRRTEERILVVRPRPLAIADAPLPEEGAALAWKPKAGGGFAENHELRDYRPGDSLNQVHWKLSAKTGALVVREAMEPVRPRVLLTVTLNGSPEELDRKLGRLLWMGDYLLNANYCFTIQARTGQGSLSFAVDNQAALLRSLDVLLCTPAAGPDIREDTIPDAQWHYHIGGQPDES